MALRHRIVKTMRDVLDEHDFLEIETPILTRSTPEGARDFLVPSRMQPGSWYALPQSPQLFKQLLMIGGYERYFQIARCFRDEDLRGFRQPEFTQLDMEMAFVDEEDVISVTEAVMAAVFEAADFQVPPTPWPRLTFDEAMLRFGSDKPDTRYGMELHDVGPLLKGSEFKVFETVLANNGVIRALNAGAREMSRSELDGLNEVVQRHGAKAVAPVYVEGDGVGRRSREVLHRRADLGGQRRARGVRRRPAAVRRRPPAHRARRARRAARRAGRALRPRPRGPPRARLGGRLPAVRARPRGGSLDGDPPPVHRAGRVVRGPGDAAIARLRPGARRRRDRRRLDPYPHG